MNFLKTYIHIVISGSKAHKTKNNRRIHWKHYYRTKQSTERQLKLVKFADDLTLVTPAAAIVSVEAEFASGQCWARDNKLQINLAKTKKNRNH